MHSVKNKRLGGNRSKGKLYFFSQTFMRISILDNPFFFHQIERFCYNFSQRMKLRIKNADMAAQSAKKIVF